MISRERSSKPDSVPKVRAAVLALAIATMSAGNGAAERIPIRSLDVRDGLAHGHVSSILQDSWGYLWFGTWEGLSRFDGYRFSNVTMADGLERPAVFDLAQDREGDIWIANWGAGVARFTDRGTGGSAGGRAVRTWSLGAQDRADDAYRVFVDGENRPWCLSMGGIFRGEGSGDSLEFHRIAGRQRADAGWVDPSGRIWFAMRDSLLLYDKGRFIDRSRPGRTPENAIVAFAQGTGEEIIVAERRALYLFDPEREPADAWTELPVRLEAGQGIFSAAGDASGAVWVGTRRGLIRLWNGGQRLYSTRQGLSDDFIRSLEFDREGNLWIGTDALGVCEIAGEEVVSYTAAGRTSGPSLVQTVEGRDGRIYATTDECGAVELRDGELSPVPGAGAAPFSNLNYRLARDGEGDWWAGTDVGLFKLEGPELQYERARRIGPDAGLPDGFVLGVWYEAQTDTLWVGLTQGGLYASAIARGRPPSFRRVGGVEAPGFEPRCVRRDRNGSLWVTGFIGIARMRSGRVDRMRTGDGLPDDQARCVFADSRGWVWLGLRNRGVSVTSNPMAPAPGWRNESIATGLSSNTVWSIAEDARDRIYLGTGRGLDRLDPATDRIRHLGTIDGLAGETVNHCLRARDGTIWLATSGGLTRIDPRAGDAHTAPPQTYFSRVEVAGVELPLSGRGVTRIDPRRFPSGTDNLRIEYVCLHFGRPNTMRYTTFLEGADRDWGPETEERAINYAHLAPGSYRLSVRAVRPEDGSVGEAAHFDFTIMPHLWVRAWFIIAVAAALVGLGLLVHRYRLRQVVAMERIRRQIAIDLAR